MIIDISHHNGKINWPEVRKTVDSVFIKATEGVNFKDPNLTKNAIAAYGAGLKVGYYHFATLNSQDTIKDAQIEAKWFVDSISKLPLNKPLVLDIETIKIKLSQCQVLMFIHTFLSELRNKGYNDLMLYSFTSFLNDNLPKDHQLGQVIPLWLADYDGAYKIPNGWKKIRLHQYTDKGKVAGITGNVDLNRYV